MNRVERDSKKYSSFWLKDDLFDDVDDGLNVVESKHSNLMALASYKKSIGNFVNIVTNDNIPVTFDVRGNDSYTDGKSVVISAKMDDKDFDSTVGLALHEGSHIKLTDFDSLDTINNHIDLVVGNHFIEDLMEKHSKDTYTTKSYISGIVKNLLNVIEDRRIDYYVYSTSPGYKGYYHSMYEKYFHSKIVDKGLQSSEYRDLDWESYMFRIINITNSNRDLDALPKLREVWNLMNLKNIQRLKSTDDSMKLASEIFKLIENSLPAEQKPIESPNQQNGGDGESDDEQSEGSGTGGGGDNSNTNGTDNTEGSGGEPKDGSDGKDDTKGDAEGGDVKAAKSYNSSKTTERFRADAPKKMPLRGVKVTPKTTPKPKLVPKVIPADKPKTETTKRRTPVGTPSIKKGRGNNNFKRNVIKVKKAVKTAGGKIKDSCKSGGKGKCGPRSRGVNRRTGLGKKR